MLWKKDSSAVDALYVDLCGPGETQNDLHEHGEPKCTSITAAPKNDLVSLERRKKGNDFFAKREWALAMEMYNESLCYAEQGSENSLAYGNRSACFYHLKLYSKCLTDIELARKAGYPLKKMPKLDERKAECLKFMKTNIERGDYQYKLSSEPNRKFPCMTNVLKIEQDNNSNYSVVAKKDLNILETVVVENTFMKYLYARYGMKCNICLKKNVNLVPCENCTVAMFCGDECQSNRFHEHECGVQFCEDKRKNSQVLSEVRRILLAVHLFPNVDELIDFVETTINSNTKQLPESMVDEKVKYGAYLKYAVDQTFVESKDFAAIISNTFNLILHIPKLRAIFNSEKYRRFLGHLIGHHAGIANRTFVVIHSGDALKGEPGNYYNYVPLMAQYFKQVFAPNLLTYEDNNHLVYVTSQLIKKGEHLTIQYLGDPNDPEYPKYKPQRKANEDERLTCRFMKLKSHCKADCKCTRCTLPPSDIPLSSDPDMDYVLSHGGGLDFNDRDDVQELINRLGAVSKKHGPSIMMLSKQGETKK